MPSRRSPRPEKCWAAVAVIARPPTRCLSVPVQLDDPVGRHAPAVQVRADAQRHQERRRLPARPAPGRSPCRGGRSGRARSRSRRPAGSSSSATGGWCSRRGPTSRDGEQRSLHTGSISTRRALDLDQRGGVAVPDDVQLAVGVGRRGGGRARTSGTGGGAGGAAACRRSARGAGCGRVAAGHRAGAGPVVEGAVAELRRAGAPARARAPVEPAAQRRRHVPGRPGQPGERGQPGRPPQPSARASARPSRSAGCRHRVSPSPVSPQYTVAITGPSRPRRRRSVRLRGGPEGARRGPVPVGGDRPGVGGGRGGRRDGQPPLLGRCRATRCRWRVAGAPEAVDGGVQEDRPSRARACTAGWVAPKLSALGLAVGEEGVGQHGRAGGVEDHAGLVPGVDEPAGLGGDPGPLRRGHGRAGCRR